MESADTAETQAGHEEGVLESFRAPPGAGTLGTWLFTAGLTIAFGWLLFGYAVTRYGSEIPSPAVPIWFWFSTFALLISSVMLHWSYLSAKIGRVTVAATALHLATATGLVFLVLQTPGLMKLIQLQQQAEGPNATPYMLVLALVGLHGIHVLVGMARLAVLNKHSHTANADADGAAHLKQMCLFWHFLTVAWVMMFGVILWT